jgi:hypothetical protein
MDEKKIFHPREVVRDLDFDVPERGGRRTINIGISVIPRFLGTSSVAGNTMPASCSRLAPAATNGEGCLLSQREVGRG